MKTIALRLGVLACLTCAVANAAEVPVPPAPTQWVTDNAGFISPETRRTLSLQLQAYEQKTGHQLLVWIGRTTGDTPIEDWAVRAFKAWRVGQKGIDNGLVVFVMAEDRKIRIEVGYGLESVVTDATSSQIIRDVMAPRIQAGDHDGAIVAGVGRLAAAIGGADSSSPGALTHRRTPSETHVSPIQLIFGGLIALFLIILFITNPGLALLLLSTTLGRRGGGGGFGGGFGGGGGGFGGGGGSSGGGGATGSW